MSYTRQMPKKCSVCGTSVGEMVGFQGTDEVECRACWGPDEDYVPPSPAALAALEAGIESAKTRPLVRQPRSLFEAAKLKVFRAHARLLARLKD